MSETHVLLKFRNKMKAKKPEFERQDYNKYKDFRGKWRRPKGIHSKVRRGFRGHKDVPSIGYSSPKSVRGLTKKGLKPLLVSNVKDLEKITKNCVAIINGRLGTKKKLEVLSLAKEKNIAVLGIKDFDSFIIRINKQLSEKKKKAESRKEEQRKREETTLKSKDTKDESKK